MALPNLSNSMSIGRLRHIQSIHESAECRNPDTLVRYFLPVTERWRTAWLSRRALAELRALPLYYYLVARTKYYDAVFMDAVAGGVGRIVNVGCGSDTRAHRFADVLRRAGVRVLECDQPETIYAKREVVKRWRAEHVEYLALDLNADRWPDFEVWLGENAGARVLVLMEGVSPYVRDDAFRQFMSLLGTALSAGSLVAYDFKLRGADDDFGRGGTSAPTFRLPAVTTDVAAFHHAVGMRLEQMVLSSELCARFLPCQRAVAFDEDGLVRLTLRRPEPSLRAGGPPRPKSA